jgi:hypothetical protein
MAVGLVSGIQRDAWQQIASTSVSAVTSFTFTNYGSAYNTLLLVGSNLHKSTSAYFGLQLNGINTAGKYAGTNVDADNYIYNGTLTANTSATYAIIYNANQNIPHSIEYAGYQGEGRGDTGLFTEASAVTSITLLSTSGNYTGTLQLWGIAG